MSMTLAQSLESLLYISHKPLSLKELAALTEAPVTAVQTALAALIDQYATQERGIVILDHDDQYQLATIGEAAPLVQKLIKQELTSELTRPSLETLTIIAYRGPVSKAELELIRGVNCSLIIRNLLIRGLIEAREDKERSTMVYTVTFDFLKFLGLERVSQLPDYERLNRSHTLDALLTGVEPTAPVVDQIN